MTASPLLIAVVDDDESVRKALQRLLRSVGLDAETFASGQLLLDSLALRRPHCIILDLHMPVLTGFDVQAAVAAVDPRVPVIIITGHDSPDAEHRALAGGAAAFLRKPIDGHLLINAIHAALGRVSPPAPNPSQRNPPP